MPGIRLSEAWKQRLRDVPFLMAFAVQLHAFQLQDYVDLRQSTPMMHEGHMGYFLALRYMAELNLDWIMEADQHFANAKPEARWFHGTVWLFLFRLISAGRLLRGPNAKHGKFAVYITNSLRVAVTYAPPGPIDGNRYILILQTRKVKSTVNKKYFIIKEYWHQILGILVLPSFQPDAVTHNPREWTVCSECLPPYSSLVGLHSEMKLGWQFIDWAPLLPLDTVDCFPSAHLVQTLDEGLVDTSDAGRQPSAAPLAIMGTPVSLDHAVSVSSSSWMPAHGHGGRLAQRLGTLEEQTRGRVTRKAIIDLIGL